METEEYLVDGETIAPEGDWERIDDPVIMPETGTITVPLSVTNLIGKAPSGQAILQTCIDLAVFLSGKNIAYGNSALNPIRIFSKADAQEQLLVRIDDKLNRIMHGEEFPGDDDILDLTGYLILYLTAKGND